MLIEEDANHVGHQHELRRAISGVPKCSLIDRRVRSVTKENGLSRERYEFHGEIQVIVL